MNLSDKAREEASKEVQEYITKMEDTLDGIHESVEAAIGARERYITALRIERDALMRILERGSK